jgi:peptidoglycan/LPS O-acetylase OafA/YrhL
MQQDSRGLVRERRNQSFDLIRILLATLVLLSHAPDVTDGNTSREIFTVLTHSGVSFGTLAVDGFFLLSGFLIVRSWEHDPNFLNFLRKRILRIVPGYVVAFLLSTIAVGLLAPSEHGFFRHLGPVFIRSLLELQPPRTPPVLSGQHYPVVNQSMWTIAYEFRCYMLIACIGMLGGLKRPALWVAATLVFLIGFSMPAVTDRIPWSHHLDPFLGNPTQEFRLIATYFVGASFYLFRKKISFRPYLAVIAAVVLLSVCIAAPRYLEIALVLAGGYLMFYFGQSKTGSRIRIKGLPDISYGIYLYGWPVECLWIWFERGSPWVTFMAAVSICVPLALLSWHFVERPMLSLKRRSTAPLPS